MILILALVLWWLFDLSWWWLVLGAVLTVGGGIALMDSGDYF